VSWYNPRSKKHPEEIQVPKLRFLGEQDGVSERELKSCLTEFFRRDQSVLTAYLARVAYGEQSPMVVALCLRSHFGPDRGVAETIGKIFASMFGGHEHLDIIFLDDKQESELAKVCSPFFGDPTRNR
jgi:SseB protein C-terminal domain